MYHINDKKQAVYELQRLLSVISKNRYDFPHITIDGLFDEATKAAVIILQDEHSVKSSGKVDKETLDIIVREYKRVLKEEMLLDIHRESFPMKKGDSGNHILAINAILSELSLYYLDLLKPISDFYSSDTEYSVKLMQRHLGIKESGIITPDTYLRLKEEVLARKYFG